MKTVPAYARVLAAVLLALVSLAACAGLPKNLPTTATRLPPPYPGEIGETGLRLYADPGHRVLIKRLKSKDPDAALPALRAAFQKEPQAQNLYVALLQGDTQFRDAEWHKYRDSTAADSDTRFRRGAVLLYKAWEWIPMGHGGDLPALTPEAIADLRASWRARPTDMTGAVLMDAYQLDAFAGSRSDPLPFTEEFLKFADPDYTWPLYLKAKQTGFQNPPAFDATKAPESRAYTVCGILGERWGLLYNFHSPHKNERTVFGKWWHAIAGAYSL